VVADAELDVFQESYLYLVLGIIGDRVGWRSTVAHMGKVGCTITIICSLQGRPFAISRHDPPEQKPSTFLFNEQWLQMEEWPLAEEREQTSENRRNGLARSQFNIVHESKPYDLEVDTSVLSPEACANVIVDWLVRDA
jgi:Chloramphenicol phosphotransferase-like protein